MKHALAALLVRDEVAADPGRLTAADLLAAARQAAACGAAAQAFAPPVTTL